MADLDPEVLKQSLADVLRASQSNSAAPTASPSAAGTSELTGIAGTLKTIADSLNGILQKIGSSTFGTKDLNATDLTTVPVAIMGLKNASDAAAGAINKLATSVPVIGSTLGKFVGNLNEVISENRRAGQQGVGQGNYFEATGQAQRAGFDNLSDQLKYLNENYNNGMRVIGKTADESNRRLSDLQEKTINSKQGQELINNGLLSQTQLAKIAGLTAAGKTDQLRTEEGRAALAEQAVKLASQMQALTDVTGMSVDQQIAQTQQLQNNTETQLQMQAMRSDAERQNLTKNQLLFGGFGEKMQNIIGTIQAGGRLTPEQQMYLTASTGGRGGQLIGLLREQQRTAGLADTDPAKIAANKALQEFKDGMSRYQNTPEFARMALQTSNPELRSALMEAAKNKERGALSAVQRETGLPAPEAGRVMREGYGQARQRGERQEGVLMQEPIKNYAQQFFRPFNEAAEGARKNTAALAGELGKLTTELGNSQKVLSTMRGAGEFIGGPVGRTQAEANDWAKNTVGSVVDTVMGKRGGATPTSVNAAGLAVTTPNVVVDKPASITINGAPAAMPATPATPAPSTPTPTPPAATPATPAARTGPDERLRPATPAPGQTRGKGTLGETGFALEAADGWRFTHKGETTATNEQLANLMQNSKSLAISDMLSNLQTATQGKKVEPSGLNLSSIFEKFNTTVSSIVSSKPEVKLPSVEKEAITPPDVTNVIPKPQIPTTETIPSKIDDMVSSIKDSFGGFNLNEKFANITAPSDIGIPNISQEFQDFFTPPEIEKPKETESAIPVPPESLEMSDKITIKDLHDVLNQLNTGIKQLVANSAETVSLSEKQIGATRKLSGNRFA